MDHVCAERKSVGGTTEGSDPEGAAATRPALTEVVAATDSVMHGDAILESWREPVRLELSYVNIGLRDKGRPIGYFNAEKSLVRTTVCEVMFSRPSALVGIVARLST